MNCTRSTDVSYYSKLYANKHQQKNGPKSYLQQVWEGKVQHVVHPCKLKSDIRPDQVVANEEAGSKAFFLTLRYMIGCVY
jgi:hypothetical protein